MTSFKDPLGFSCLSGGGSKVVGITIGNIVSGSQFVFMGGYLGRSKRISAVVDRSSSMALMHHAMLLYISLRSSRDSLCPSGVRRAIHIQTITPST